MDLENQFLSHWRDFCRFHPEEIPSFSVLFAKDGSILAKSGNSVEQDQNASQHSELLCIHKATSITKEKYLTDAILFTSLEPCLQCAGSIIKVKLNEVVYFCASKPGEGISSLATDSIYLMNHFPKLRLLKNEEVRQEFQKFFLEKR